MPSIGSQYGPSGPIVDVSIAVSEPLRRVLLANGRQPPPRLRLPFIIDTGADTTMVHDIHMRSLGIDVRGMRSILPSTTDAGEVECPTYDISLHLATYGDPDFVVPALEVLARPLFNHSIEGMIGRDVLSRLTFTLDGRNGRFRLEY